MNLPRYHLKSSITLETIEFISEGSKGRITKLVQFSQTNLPGVYNLAFGDKDKDGKIDDEIISNNGDSGKVLASVVASVYVFTDKNPGFWIYATGSTKSRIRLYRMGISKYYLQAEKDFEIYGQIGDAWEIFTKDCDYEGF